MARTTFVLIAMSSAFCGDPAVEVRFRIPIEYRAQVAQVALRVLEPRAAEIFDCEDLAFQRVDSDILRLSVTSELTTTEAEVVLPEINRRGEKILIAEGFATDGTSMVVGCNQLGEIANDVQLLIQGEPRSQALLAQSVLNVPTSTATPFAIDAQVVDALGRVLANSVVEWQVHGLDGLVAEDTATANTMGQVHLVPPVSTSSGPMVVELRFRWSQTPVLQIPGFVLAAPERIKLDGAGLSYHAGRVGPNGESGLAAFLFRRPSSVQVVRLYRSPEGGLVRNASDLLTADLYRLVVVPDARHDRLIAVSATKWNEFLADGRVVGRPNYISAAPGQAMSSLFPAGGCGDATTAGVLVGYANGTIAEYELNGQHRATWPDAVWSNTARVVGSGCVSDQAARLLRTYVIDGAVPGGLVVVAAVDGQLLRSPPWRAVNFGLSFGEAGDKFSLLGSQFQVNDFVFSRLGLNLTTDTVAFNVEDVLPLPGIAQRTAAGDIDNDGLLDSAAIYVVGDSTTPPLQFGLWLGTGKQRQEQRMAAFAHLRGLGDYELPQPLLFDDDGDGDDDLWIGNVAVDPAKDGAGLELYRMGPR